MCDSAARRRRQAGCQASACQHAGSQRLHPDEATNVAWVLLKGQAIEFYDRAHLAASSNPPLTRVVIRSTTMPQSSCSYISLLPLKTSQRVVGVLRLVVEDDSRRFPREKSLSSEMNRSDPRATFFWTFLDQIASMIEHARLHRESMQVEVLQRTDALRAALVSSISHDLRTPLTSIKAAASSLLQNDVQWDDEARQSFAQSIEREADRLNRLVENLLENALRYTPAGSPLEITVRVSATELLVSVADRRPGIPAGDLERVFDKFYRVLDRSRDTAGSGLGLSVCRGLVEAHGGRIWVKNRPEGGAIFCFTLPLHPQKSSDHETQEEVAASVAGE